MSHDHSVRDELVEHNVHRHSVQTSAQPAWVERESRPFDDPISLSDLARIRRELGDVDYSVHTQDARPAAASSPRRSASILRRCLHIGSAILAGVLFALAVLALTAWLSRARADTPAPSTVIIQPGAAWFESLTPWDLVVAGFLTGIGFCAGCVLLLALGKGLGLIARARAIARAATSRGPSSS